MLRPKSALFYIDEITGVSNDLLNLVASNMNQDRTIDDVTPLMYRWSLEAVSAIFLDTRYTGSHTKDARAASGFKMGGGNNLVARSGNKKLYPPVIFLKKCTTLLFLKIFIYPTKITVGKCLKTPFIHLTTI